MIRRLCSLALLLAACTGKPGGDTDTDTETDGGPSTSFGSFDDAPGTFTTADDNDVWGSTTTADGPDDTTTSAPTTVSESATDTDGSTTMAPTETSSSGGETDPTHGDPGNCCEAHPDEVGCENEGVEACVCENDPQCCDLTWDDACVVGVVIYGCGQCEGIGGDGDCCEAHDNPGCDDDEIEACVCAMDIACCNAEWDQICVDQVAELRCGMC